MFSKRRRRDEGGWIARVCQHFWRDWRLPGGCYRRLATTSGGSGFSRESSVTYDAPDKPGNEIVFGEGLPTSSEARRAVDLVPPAELSDEQRGPKRWSA